MQTNTSRYSSINALVWRNAVPQFVFDFTKFLRLIETTIIILWELEKLETISHDYSTIFLIFFKHYHESFSKFMIARSHSSVYWKLIAIHFWNLYNIRWFCEILFCGFQKKFEKFTNASTERQLDRVDGKFLDTIQFVFRDLPNISNRGWLTFSICSPPQYHSSLRACSLTS